MEPEHRILLVAAHPDDETIGAAGRLSRVIPETVTILHITDGSPRDLSFARAAGFYSREDYADARRRELAQSLALIGIHSQQCIGLDYVDQEACLHLAEISSQIADLCRKLKPERIFTHPYEGGHPDHDSAAFCVCQAVCNASDIRGPELMEFTSYHAGPHGLETGGFLPTTGGPSETVVLSGRERRLKSEMFACFRTQQRVLRAFSIDEENFRPAPSYNFKQPPHSGTLHYEQLGWGITGERWRALASEALILT